VSRVHSRATASTPPPPIRLTLRLFDVLNDRHVGYCHWKSTTGLATALAGQTDLDLLVLEEDAGRFVAAAEELGFRPFRSHASRTYPGVTDFLGHDVESGRLVHLHVYQRLVLGQRYVKNHHLPIERELVSTSVTKDGVRVPRPELEVMILAIRVLLKYRDLDALRDLVRLGRRAGVDAGALDELRDLARRIDPAVLQADIAIHVPSLDPHVVLDLLELVRTRPRDARRLLALRGRVRRAMRPYQRRSAMHAWLSYARARLARQWPVSLIVRPITKRAGRRKSPMRGGVTIAVVGADGAGKTTVIDALNDWLAWRVNTATLYLGSARPSRGTRGLKVIARGSRALSRVVGGDRLARALMALRYLGDARDRLSRAVRARQLASRGFLVLLDRYPLPGELGDGRTLDGPRVRAQLGTDTRELRRLAAMEEAIYRRLPAPDHVIALHVSAAVALARKPSQDPASIAAKARALATSSWRGASVTQIDAGQPLEAVLRDARKAVWRLV
jgi:thymidylate kinase